MFEKLVPFFDHTFPYNSETLELYCFYFARYTKLRTKFVQNSWTKEVSSFRRIFFNDNAESTYHRYAKYEFALIVEIRCQNPSY